MDKELVRVPEGLPGVATPGRMEAQADTDEQLTQLWLHGRSPNTLEAYTLDLRRFRTFVGKPLRQVKLRDVQAYSDTLKPMAPATKGRMLAVVKSLFTFGSKLGYLAFNVAAAVKVPTAKNTLAERILTEEDTLRMLALEPDKRNHALLRLLYAGALRVSEFCALQWEDLQPSGDAGQITVFGKGGKTRSVLLSPATWQELMSLREGDGEQAPVFRSRFGGHLSRSQVMRIVRDAARRAGINKNVSPHWMRHAHASHNLDRGTPLHLVQATLGHSSVAVTGRYLHARPGDSSARYLAV